MKVTNKSKSFKDNTCNTRKRNSPEQTFAICVSEAQRKADTGHVFSGIVGPNFEITPFILFLNSTQEYYIGDESAPIL